MTDNPFDKLHPKVQRWVFDQQWQDLRPVQQQAVAPIMAKKQDVIIAASTAAGKTEAFFLPALSHLKLNQHHDGIGIIYISPLKALINDQYRRLQGLCEQLDVVITPWHGDSAQGQKRQLKKQPTGVLLITPESLESMLIRESSWLNRACHDLQYVVIDEFHAFIGSERGHHLLSLLNRLDHLNSTTKRFIPRVALSATLGEIEKVPAILRPNSTNAIIIENHNSQAKLQLQVKGYLNHSSQDSKVKQTVETRICDDLYQICRGSSNLIFANSRQLTEAIAVNLTENCKNQAVPNEFFPHHGSLAKELRESVEHRLQQDIIPTTAVCTMTLELGIDIGKVNGVVQVNAPHSVASLRQRLGRSGRRGDTAKLRILISENELNINSNVVDKLRLALLQSLAMVRLLISNRWFEPPDTQQYHFSTLLHQILALIAQWGGIRADQMHHLLIKTGPFKRVTTEQYKQLLCHMGQEKLIQQLGSGEMVLGELGENIVSHYTFYPAFHTPQEYRIIAGSKTLGSLPIASPILEMQHIIFAGKRWQVIEVDSDKKCIYVQKKAGGKPPSFGGEGMSVDDKIRAEMLTIAREGDYRIDVGERKIDFIDTTAKELFLESQRYFKDLKLVDKRMFQQETTVYLLPWLGDQKTNTMNMLLVMSQFESSAFAGVIEIRNTNLVAVSHCLRQLSQTKPYTNQQLAKKIKDKHKDKFDHYLPETLLTQGYGARHFDTQGVYLWLENHF